MRFAPLFVRSGLVLVAALGVTQTAYAVAPPPLDPRPSECDVDNDCGHGFACQSSITSTAPGGGSDVPGSAGTGSSGAGGGSFGTGGAPATGGSVGAPVPATVCGNQLCEPPEGPESCPSDCVVYRYCSLAECETASDCAEGYTCAEASAPGTGGGPSAPICGDGVCNGGPETSTSCPEDCLTRSYCSPQSGYCLSDSDCVAGFYCSFYGSGSGSGSGGFPGTGGFGAASGTAGTTSTPGAGGTGTGGSANGGYSGAEDAGQAPEPEPPSDEALQGTCMPAGAGGVGGTDGGGGISGSAGTSGSVGIGGSAGSTGGTRSEGGTAGETGGTGGSAPRGGTGGTGSGNQSGTSNGGQGATSPGSGASAGKPKDDDVVVTRGCSVSEQSNGTSSAGALAFLALALVGGLRRRRAR